MKKKFPVLDGKTVFVEEKTSSCSSEPRVPKEEELKGVLTKRMAIRALKRDIEQKQVRLDALIENCDHKICYDSEGYPYDTRACFICETGMGAIYQ